MSMYSRPYRRNRAHPGAPVSMQAGFTLIELIVTIAIVAILAVIAVQSYQFAVVKTRRATAESCLVEQAQYMERFYTTNMRYDEDGAGNAFAMPTPQECVTELGDFYAFDFAAGPTAAEFTVRAAPVEGRQNDSRCGTLTLDNTGLKTASGSASVDECW